MRRRGLVAGLTGLVLASLGATGIGGVQAARGQALAAGSVAHREVDLTSISAVAGNDAWAVGTSENPSQPVALHWNGHRWVPHNVDGVFGNFNAVDAVARDDVWAVGVDYSQKGRALIEHWDGTGWTRVEGPVEHGGYFLLDGIGSISPDDVYAFGRIVQEKEDLGRQAPALDDTITIHWDGTSWSEVPHGGADLEALDSLSPTDAWRVGRSPTGTSYTEHWDGTTWTKVPSPTLGNDNDLVSVTMLASDDVWVAGDAYEQGTYTLHWNGVRWHLFRDVQTGGVVLGVDGTASGPVWLTGGSVPGATIERWTGQKWKPVDNPAGSAESASLDDVAAISPTDAWAVGSLPYKRHGMWNSRRLLVHWDGSTWTRYQKPGADHR